MISLLYLSMDLDDQKSSNVLVDDVVDVLASDVVK